MPSDSSTALDWIMQYVTDEGPQVVRGMLGRMLFAGDDALKPTSALSGGEAARLLLAKLMLMKDPILIFDEPTNHLDLEAVSALAEGFSTFPGTVFVVSHDRDLVSEVSTPRPVVRSGGPDRLPRNLRRVSRRASAPGCRAPRQVVILLPNILQ